MADDIAKKMTSDTADKSSPDDPLESVDLDEALRNARAGTLSVEQLVHAVAAGAVVVPLAGPMPENAESGSWQPITMTKRDDGSQWLVVFTNAARAAEFARATPGVTDAIEARTAWVMKVMPPDHGLLCNPGSDDCFEWSSAGLAAYQAQFGG